MKVSFRTKLFLALLISFVLLLLGCNYNVKASNIENTEGILLNSEEKIMKYDARTGEITEVGEEELLNATGFSKSMQEGIRLNSYDPYPVARTSANTTAKSALGHRVTDTSPFPYRTTCQITCRGKDKDGEIVNYGGSASLVGPNLVLTAAHAVFNEIDNNEPFTQWYCSPAYNYDFYENKPFEEAFKQKCYSGYTEVYFSTLYFKGDLYSDWAICVLEKPLGQYLGYFRITRLFYR